MNTPETKTAFVAIVGCPNVGKSSLLNRMIGQKVAIVTSKPQTTRTRIMGVLTLDETQLVFTDTPGYHRPHNKLGEKMNQAVSDSISGVDACLFVVEPRGELRPEEQELLRKFRQQDMPVVLAINKIDTECALQLYGCGACLCCQGRWSGRAFAGADGACRALRSLLPG